MADIAAGRPSDAILGPWMKGPLAQNRVLTNDSASWRSARNRTPFRRPGRVRRPTSSELKAAVGLTDLEAVAATTDEVALFTPLAQAVTSSTYRAGHTSTSRPWPSSSGVSAPGRPVPFLSNAPVFLADWIDAARWAAMSAYDLYSYRRGENRPEPRPSPLPRLGDLRSLA